MGRYNVVQGLTAQTIKAHPLNSPPSLSCGEWKTVPQGWTTPEPGVWGDLKTARDTTAALQSQRKERDAWRAEVRKAKSTALLWVVLAGGIGFAVGRR